MVEYTVDALKDELQNIFNRLHARGPAPNGEMHNAQRCHVGEHHYNCEKVVAQVQYDDNIPLAAS